MRLLATILCLAGLLSAQIVKPEEFTNKPAGWCPLVVTDSWNYNYSSTEVIVENVPPGTYNSISFRGYFTDSRRIAKSYYGTAKVIVSINGPTCANASSFASNLNGNQQIVRDGYYFVPDTKSAWPPGLNMVIAEPAMIKLDFVVATPPNPPFPSPLVITATTNVVFHINWFGTQGLTQQEQLYVDGGMINAFSNLYRAPYSLIWKNTCGHETQSASYFTTINGAVNLYNYTMPNTSLSTTIVNILASSTLTTPFSLPINYGTVASCEIFLDPNSIVATWVYPAWFANPYVAIPNLVGLKGRTLYHTHFGTDGLELTQYPGSYAINYPSEFYDSSFKPNTRSVRVGGGASEWCFPVVILK
jgi:hypothetical protein